METRRATEHGSRRHGAAFQAARIYPVNLADGAGFKRLSDLRQ